MEIANPYEDVVTYRNDPDFARKEVERYNNKQKEKNTHTSNKEQKQNQKEKRFKKIAKFLLGGAGAAGAIILAGGISAKACQLELVGLGQNEKVAIEQQNNNILDGNQEELDEGKADICRNFGIKPENIDFIIKHGIGYDQRREEMGRDELVEELKEIEKPFIKLIKEKVAGVVNLDNIEYVKINPPDERHNHDSVYFSIAREIDIIKTRTCNREVSVCN